MSEQTKDGDKARPIIIRRVRGGHHGHHGGAWKVAYADFVTAMMAFFMVMWIMGMDPQTKDMIQGYFQNPVGFKKGFGAGHNPLSAGNALRHEGPRTVAVAPRETQLHRFRATAEAIQRRIAADSALAGLAGNFEITITNEGIRIEMTDAGASDAFFALGSAVPRPLAIRAFTIIGEELAKIDNDIVIEGHTDAKQYGTPVYTNWELSVDRANAARRVMLNAGVGSDRVKEVRGLADRHLRMPCQPFNSANRRVSILVPYEGVTPTPGGPIPSRIDECEAELAGEPPAA